MGRILGEYLTRRRTKGNDSRMPQQLDETTLKLQQNTFEIAALKAREDKRKRVTANLVSICFMQISRNFIAIPESKILHVEKIRDIGRPGNNSKVKFGQPNYVERRGIRGVVYFEQLLLSDLRLTVFPETSGEGCAMFDYYNLDIQAVNGSTRFDTVKDFAQSCEPTQLFRLGSLAGVVALDLLNIANLGTSEQSTR